MSLYCFTTTPPAPGPTTAPAPTPAPQPVVPCESFTEEACYIDSRQNRIMEQRTISDTDMSAEVGVGIT